jgi:hypothetical protein
MGRRGLSISVIVPCRTSPSTGARNAGSPIALGLVASRAGKASSPPTTGLARYYGPVRTPPLAGRWRGNQFSVNTKLMSKSGERYKSKKAMMRHEKGESKREEMMEYGSMKTKNHGTSRKKCS